MESLNGSLDMPQAKLAGLQILVVDDSRAMRALTCRFLEHAGSTVIDSAAGGAEALAKLQERSYDVMLLDLQMPEVDGCTVGRQVKADGLPIRLVAVTAEESAEQRAVCAAIGFDGYLIKPFSPESLAHIITSVIGERPEPSVP